MIKKLLFLSLFFTSFSIAAQKKQGNIQAEIKDSVSKAPMEYVTATLYTADSNNLVTGGVTDLNGAIELKNVPYGKYKLVFSFVGYQSKTINNLVVSSSNSSIDLGIISLQNNLNLKEVVVKTDIPTVTYEIDKKVVNVEDMNTVAGQTAVEVLENVPSIQTDLDGNILLRGNSGFTLLINGIPSAMDATDALRSIPASTIKDIEIVTNPSARDQAEGSAGIINIITKKSSIQGASLLLNLNAGNFNRYGGDVNLNYKTKKHALNFNGNINYRNRYSVNTEERLSTNDSNTTFISENGVHNWGTSNFQGSVEWQYTPSEKQVLTISSEIGRRFMYPTSTSFFREEINGELINSYRNEEYSDITIPTLSNSLAYRYHFDEEQKHYLSFTTIYNRRSVDEYTYARFYRTDDDPFGGNSGTEFGPSSILRFNVDYVKPLNKLFTLEAGAQIQFGTSADDRENFVYVSASQSDILLPDFSTDVAYSRNVHGGYFLFKGKYKDLGYQFGLRGEYTYRNIETSNTTIGPNQQEMNRFDWFPSLHFSYKLNDKEELLASISRRIERPRSYFFEPFITFMSVYSVRQGNPSLLPEFVQSAEASYINKFNKKGNFTLDIYSKYLTNLIQRVPQYYDTNIIMTVPQNTGNFLSSGLETTITYELFDFWTTNLGANFYHYRVQSTIGDLTSTRSSFNYGFRFRNTFTLPSDWKIQLMSNYNSKTITALGEESDNFGVDASLSKSFFKRKLSLNFQAQNVLNTQRRFYTSNLNEVSVYNSQRPLGPMFVLTASLSLNDYKKRYEKNAELDDF